MAAGVLATRRQTLVLGALFLGAALLGSTGCSTGGRAAGTSQGFASDTEVRAEPVSLKLFADSNLKWMQGGSAAAQKLGCEGLNHLEEYVARYQSQTGREGVSIEVEYVDPLDMLLMSRNGYDDGDGAIGLDQVVEEGSASGILEGGEGGYMVRDMSYNFPMTSVMVRAKGSDVMLPDADTIDGEDYVDGTINRMQKLDEFDGVIAIADPETTTEGWMGNMALARWGFYSDESGRDGEYIGAAADRVRLYDTQEDAMEAVASRECQLGFALRCTLRERFTDVEECYKVPYANSVRYKAASVAGSENGAVMRDFLTFITMCTD